MSDLSDKERDKLAEDVNNIDLIKNIPKLYKKLLHLDGDYPLFFKINNIIIMLLGPLFLFYDMVGRVIDLPLTNIISIESFGLLFSSWLIIVCVVGISYYSVKRYKILTEEEHIATLETHSDQTYNVYTTNQTHTSNSNLKSNAVNDPKSANSEEYNNTYILLNNNLTLPPINNYTYDNKKIINIFCYMVGINIVTERDLVEYILYNYEEEEIEIIFEQENTKLSKEISSQLVLENI